MKKNIWIMNHYAGDMLFDRGGRHYNFAKYLRRAGYAPVIFCANSKHGKAERYFETDVLWEERIAEEIDTPFVFVRARTYTGNGKQRVLNMIDFYRNVKKAAKEYAAQHGKPDVIYASSVHPLTLVAGLQLAKQFGVKCVCEVRDLWPESLVVLSERLAKHTLFVRLLYRGERWIYRKADTLIFTFEGDYDYITERGWDKDIPRSKVHYINNGVDLEQFDRNREDFRIDDPELNDPSTFKVVYTGAIRLANGVGMILDCAECLKDQPDIRFLIYGSGEDLESLREQKAARRLDNVSIKGQVGKQYIPYVLSRGDLNLLNYLPSAIRLFRFGSSQNKKFEYLASGRPLLENTKTAYDVVEQYHCGVCEQIEDGKSYAEAVLRMKSLTPEAYQSYCANARRAAEDYDFKRLTDKLMAVIENIPEK